MNKFNKKVYLAGAISCFYNENRKGMATIWREQVVRDLKEFGIKCFNPCDEPDNCWEYDTSGIIKQNYFYLSNCDIVLVNLNMINDSIGTIWELSMAWREHKPVIAFGDTPWIDRPHMKSLIDMKFDTVDEAVNYIIDMYSL